MENPSLVVLGAPVALYVGQFAAVRSLLIILFIDERLFATWPPPTIVPGAAGAPFCHSRYPITVFGETPMLYLCSTFDPSSPVTMSHCTVISSAIGSTKAVPSSDHPVAENRYKF